MRFRHKLTERNTAKRVVSFLLMLCLLVPMLPSSIGLDAKAEDDPNTTENTGDTVTIKLHDLYIDRKEALDDSVDLQKVSKREKDKCLDAYLFARSIKVKKGTTLEQIFDEASAANADAELKKNTTLGTSSLEKTGVYKKGTEDDKAMTSVIDAKNCVWYTRDGGENDGVDGNNARHLFNSDTAINDNIDLYTYSYRIRLITKNASENDRYKDLIVREGQKKGFVYGSANNTDDTSISTFLTNNSVNDAWTDINENTKANPSALTDGITRNYALRAEGVTLDTVNVSCKVAINGQWTDAGTITMDKDRVDAWGKTGPALNYYVTDDELLKVYKSYGFTKDMLTEQTEISTQINGYFPFRNGDKDTLHIRQLPKQVEGEKQFRIPLVEDTTTDVSNLQIYYTPHNIEGYASRFLNGTKDRNGWASVTDSAVLKENSFYTVSVDSDDKNNFSSELPDTKLLYGESGSFDLPLKDKDGKAVRWYVEKGGDNVTITTDSDKATVAIKNIEQEVVLTTNSDKQDADAVKVHCYVLIDGKEKEVSTLHFSESQHEKHVNEWGNNERYYVSTQTLEEVYADYGFKASEYNGERYFPNTVHTTDKYNDATLLWADATAVAYSDNSGYYKIPLTDLSYHDTSEKENKKNIDVVYTPHNQNGYSSYFGENQKKGKSRTDNTLLTENSFFSVTVKDEANKFSEEALPKTQYVLSGKDAEITVPAASGVEWYLSQAPTENESYVMMTTNGDTTTVSIPNINHAIELTTDSTHKSSDIITLHCYALVNKQEVEVSTVYFKLQSEYYSGWGGYSRYFVSTQVLEKVYANYGFEASKYSGERYFPCTIHSNFGNNKKDTLWIDAPAVEYDSSNYYKIPLLNTQGSGAEAEAKKNIDLFYAPQNTTTTSVRRDDSTFISNNTFYTIDFEDPEKKFSNAKLPDTQYALTGTDKTVTLPYNEKVNWFQNSTKLTPVEGTIDSTNGKAQYTISKVTQKTTITTAGIADDKVAVQGYISLDGKWKNLSSMEITTEQSDGKNFYLTSDQLETLFGSCGFKASDYQSKDAEKLGQHFLNPDASDSSKLVATKAALSGDTWQVTTSTTTDTKTKVVKLYYVPNNKTETPDASSLEADNTFYSISFADDGKTGITVPDTQYILKDSNKTLELPKEAKNWFCTASVDDAQIALSSTTFEITNANQSLKFNTALEDYAVTVHGRIFVDDEPYDVTTIYLKNQTASDWANGARYYVTAKTLSLIYSAYGFDLSKYHPNASQANDDPQNLWFPNAVHEQQSNDPEWNNPEVLWDDTTPSDSNDGKGYKIALSQKSSKFTDLDLYYVPNTTKEHMVVTNNKKQINNAIFIGSSLDSTKNHAVNYDFINANSFYSIQFQDPNNKLNKGTKLPDTEYKLSGTTNVQVTVPYQEGVTWHVTDKQGNPIDMTDISQKVNGNTVTFTIPTIDQPLVFTTADVNKDSVSDNSVALNAYVAIDDEWVPIGSEWTEVDGELTGGTYSISDKQHTGNSTDNTDRYYITARQLKNIFGKYGFTGTLPTDKNPFANNTIIPDVSESLQANQRLIYADILPEKQYIRTVKVALRETGISIYYVPNGYGTESKWRKDDAGLLKANSVQYTVSVADPNGLLSDAQKADLPKAKRWERGATATITLPALSGDMSWVRVNAKTREKITDGIANTTSDGKITYTITNITQPIEFIAQKTPAITIQYDVGFVDSDKQQLGSDFATDVAQTVLQDGTIQGATSYWDYPATRSTEYATLEPDRDYVQVEVSNMMKGRIEPREFYYTFKGWKIVAGDTSISTQAAQVPLGKNAVDIQPGEKIDLTKYADSTTLKLKSVWEAYDAKGRPTTVNFYLSTSCEVKDNISNGFQGQAKENFTTTIYSTRIKGTDPISSDWEKEFQVIAPPNNESTAYQTDKTLRESVNTEIPYSDGNAQINLESFPSDEEILSTLRKRVKAGVAKVTLDGNEIPASDLNTTNYEVRWYVLKYHRADSWHIDGVLVAKEGHVVVTKTFDGDEKAIKYVKGTKDNKDGTAYAISVTHESTDSDKNPDSKDNTMPRNDTDVVDYMLALEPKEKTDDDSTIRGYDSYDAATDTYTWILSGRQGREYTLQEQNYQVNEEEHQWSGTYQYMIRNSPTESDGTTKDTDGWLSYTSRSKKITLKAAAYASDAPTESYQMVSFKNTYVPYGSISLAKIDATTGSPLKNVSFTLTDANGNLVTLYRKPGTSEYKHARHTDSDNASYTEEITDGKITTNENGMLYLGLAQGKYTLTEIPPFGYDGPSSITFSVDENGKIIKEDLDADVENLDTEQKATSDWVIVSDNQALLTVKNTSKMLVTVTAKKVWENTDKDKIKPVTVSLYRNGVKMSGDKYTQELSEKNNWVYTWYDLPLYVDDAIAEYSLREEKIGDTDYDLSNGSNGYRDYLVVYDSTKYVENLADSTHPEADTNWTGAGTSASWKDANGSTVYAKHALLVVKNSSAESDLVLKKTDSLGNALAGAVFGVYSDKDCKNLISKSESDSNGYVRFKSHSSLGNHVRYLKEISAPDGCTPDTTIYTVTVTVDGGKSTFTITDPNGEELSKTTTPDAQGNTYYQIQNQSAIALQIKKIDADGNALSGAEFTVTKDGKPFGGKNGNGVYTVPDDNTGIVKIQNSEGKLPEGTYRIEETQTPDPTFQKACPIIVTIQGGRVMYETDTTVSNTNKDAWQLVQREGTATYVLRVVNKAPSFLPSTGGSGILLPILFGSALMCGASALALWLRKRRKNG